MRFGLELLAVGRSESIYLLGVRTGREFGRSSGRLVRARDFFGVRRRRIFRFDRVWRQRFVLLASGRRSRTGVEDVWLRSYFSRGVRRGGVFSRDAGRPADRARRLRGRDRQIFARKLLRSFRFLLGVVRRSFRRRRPRGQRRVPPFRSLVDRSWPGARMGVRAVPPQAERGASAFAPSGTPPDSALAFLRRRIRRRFRPRAGRSVRSSLRRSSPRAVRAFRRRAVSNVGFRTSRRRLRLGPPSDFRAGRAVAERSFAAPSRTFERRFASARSRFRCRFGVRRLRRERRFERRRERRRAGTTETFASFASVRFRLEKARAGTRRRFRRRLRRAAETAATGAPRVRLPVDRLPRRSGTLRLGGASRRHSRTRRRVGTRLRQFRRRVESRRRAAGPGLNPLRNRT